MRKLCVLLVVGAVGALATPARAAGPKVVRSSFGTLNGTGISKYTITNSKGMQVAVITYGGIIQSIKGPDPPRHPRNLPPGVKKIGGGTAPPPPPTQPP